MSKFGELVGSNIPVLIDFYTEWNEASVNMHPILRDVASAVGDKAKVIKIDVDKNTQLAEALRVKGLPTLMIYKNGEMMWRKSGEQKAEAILSRLEEYS
ncbi:MULTISPECIES: thioredoxin family protein [unclassified Zunongwangia]|uniref:thioredoxin family protein n=1 Tax=unclassified Zunongwangia TaxID=2632541 RepID=UPI0022DD3025|nr:MULTISPECIES: thioredoxin family protein [unclassified Zunongwangia]WBL22070.1 thioredoxin family protein [Zunongwangia sp. HRR-M8]WBL25982.1 thioredoxin family protein [Zunongwangia sp. HGR-M22]